MTRTMRQYVVMAKAMHYMTGAWVGNTACGRHVTLSGSALTWTPDAHAVTCGACYRAMGL